MKTSAYAVSGKNVEIIVDMTVFDLAIINLGNQYALVETSGNDTDWPVIFVSKWTLEDIFEGLKQMSLFGYTVDQPAVTEEQLKEIAEYLYQLELQQAGDKNE